MESKLYKILFKPGHLPIGQTGLSATDENNRSQFKIQDMNLSISKSNDNDPNPEVEIGGNVNVTGEFRVNGGLITASGGQDADITILPENINNTGEIQRMTINNPDTGFTKNTSLTISLPRVLDSSGNPLFLTNATHGQKQPFPTDVEVEYNDPTSPDFGKLKEVTIKAESNTTFYPNAPNITLEGGDNSNTSDAVSASMKENKSNEAPQSASKGLAFVDIGPFFNPNLGAVNLNLSNNLNKLTLDELKVEKIQIDPNNNDNKGYTQYPTVTLTSLVKTHFRGMQLKLHAQKLPQNMTSLNKLVLYNL